jgi:hypothetical protein
MSRFWSMTVKTWLRATAGGGCPKVWLEHDLTDLSAHRTLLSSLVRASFLIRFGALPLHGNSAF